MLLEGSTGGINEISILFPGGYDHDLKDYSDRILMFNKETRKFDEKGKLEQRRDRHSMSLVNMSDYACK